MSKYQEAVKQLKNCDEVFYLKDEEFVGLSNEDYEACKDLLRMAKQIHDKARSQGGTRRVIKRLDAFREGYEEPPEPVEGQPEPVVEPSDYWSEG